MNIADIERLLKVAIRKYILFKKSGVLPVLQDSFSVQGIEFLKENIAKKVYINEALMKINKSTMDNISFKVDIMHRKVNLNSGVNFALGDDCSIFVKYNDQENKFDVLEELC